MKFKGIFILAVLVLAGCARMSSPTLISKAEPVPEQRIYSYQKATPKNPSTLVVVRDDGFFGGRCFHGIWINGALAARLEPGEVATFYVEPGEYVLTVGNIGTGNSACDAHQDRINRETTVKPGQKKVFRALWNKNDGIPDLQPYVTNAQ